jgi:hypothetical protein
MDALILAVLAPLAVVVPLVAAALLACVPDEGPCACPLCHSAEMED